MFITAVVSFLYRWRYALDVIRHRRRSVKDDEAAEVFLYDCFVCFNMANVDWIEDDLLPNMEPPERGMRMLRPEENRIPVTQDMDNFRLAVHHRDFRVGLHITDNICDALQQSRTILMVVSNPALRAQWWHFELRMAIETAVLRRNNCLLFVFLEPIEAHLVTPQLRRILTMYTCERWWPRDLQKQRNLWMKLISSIQPASTLVP